MFVTMLLLLVSITTRYISNKYCFKYVLTENKVLYDKLTNYHLEILSCQYRDQVWNWYEYMGILSHVKDFDDQLMILKMGFFMDFDEY